MTMPENRTRIRIQKALSAGGVASRRAVEEMILQGRITVNGKAVASLPCFVDLAADNVRVDGRAVGGRPKRRVYYLLNKPRGVVCTQRDPAGRPRATDLVPKTAGRVYCAGRLDADSTGIIILTNDGELTEYLTHPRYEVTKTYVVEITGKLDAVQIERLKKGTYIDGKRTGGTWVKVLRGGPARSLLEIRLREGRNREIRRVLARLGHKVRQLKRVAIGPVTDRGLAIGNFRALGAGEVSRLRRCGKTKSSKPVGGGKPPRRSARKRTAREDGPS